MERPIKEKALKVEQSNYLTTAQYDYTPQEKRILYRIVEKAYDFKTQNEEWFKAVEQANHLLFLCYFGIQ